MGIAGMDRAVLGAVNEDDTLAAGKERAWREVAAIDAAHASGELDDAGWHQAIAAIVVPAYLSAPTTQGGSGHEGTAADWEHSRGIVAEAIDRDGTFLDVGCANGLLMESVVRWAAARGRAIEPYGLDIAPELAALARRRLPEWAGRIYVGNALGWVAPRPFDYVRVGLEYVPQARRPDLVRWLLDRVVAPGGRLIVGKFNEELEPRATEVALASWGFPIAGRAERPNQKEPRLAYRVVWIDRGGGPAIR
jgi:SAM-dependent methyltransferase